MARENAVIFEYQGVVMEHIEGLDENLVSTFHLGETLLGISTQKIQEIIKVGNITQIPHAPSYILGILNLRGRIVTVVDLGSRLSLGDSQKDEQSRIIILDDIGESVGIMVDRVEDVIPVDSRDLRPPPANLKSIQGDFFDHIYQSEHGLVGLLNVDAILAID